MSAAQRKPPALLTSAIIFVAILVGLALLGRAAGVLPWQAASVRPEVVPGTVGVHLIAPVAEASGAPVEVANVSSSGDASSAVGTGASTVPPSSVANADDPLYVCDLHDYYLDHQEYCRIFSRPGEWCARFGPSPEGKSFDDLVYDYDVTVFAATLQGVVNKAGPRLYLIHDGDHVQGGSVDRFWLDRFRDGTKPYGWLAGRPVIEISGIDGLLQTFAKDVAGAVVWDGQVPATLNVATTMAGVENLVVVREGSRILDNVTAQIPVRSSLVGKFTAGAQTIPDSTTPSTGSAKDDAYIWAKEKYLDSGQTDPTLLAYYEDGWPVVLYQRDQMTRKGTYAFERDYAVQNRAFVFDVSPFETKAGSTAPEMPIDDPNQPAGADLRTFKAILESARIKAGRSMIRVWGFVPWYQKYTNAYESGGTHTDVDSEWESSWLLSAHGAFLEGGGGDVNGIALANMSFHDQAPFPERVPQNPPPTRDQLIARGFLTPEGQVVDKTYLMYYAGDYDLAHNVYGRTNEIDRSLHGPEDQRVPLAWGLNPALVDVMPGIINYIMTERSDQDYFVGPDSGAGYLNPGALPDTLAPSWVAWSLQFYRRLGYSIQGWVLNGKGGKLSPKKASVFLDMGGDGISVYPPDLEGSWPRLDGPNHNIPVVAMAIPGLPWTVDEAVPLIHKAFEDYRGNGPKFIIGRLTCCTRQEYSELTQRIQADPQNAEANYEVVDPYTFFYLLKVSLGQPITDRASYIGDTIPAEVLAGSTVEVDVSIRNDGWETWSGDGSYLLGLQFQEGPIPPRSLLSSRSPYPIRVVLPQAIAPGQAVTLRFNLAMPAQPGHYTLQYDMIAPGGAPFEAENDLPWQKVLVVR